MLNPNALGRFLKWQFDVFEKLFINHQKTEKMKKISLKNVKETLTRKEMRLISGGYSCTYRCWSGGGSGSSGNTTMSEAVSIANANCGSGNYSVVCV